MKTRMNVTMIRVASVVMMIGSLLSANQASAWGRFDGGHHPVYGGGWAHRSPVVVHNTYVNRGGGGCVGCGIGGLAVAGLVGGAILGAAIVGANSPPPPPPTVIYQQSEPMYQQSAPVVVQGPAVGQQVSILPPGCNSMNINGGQYYQCGAYWYQPFFGGNGVYYTMVPTP
jgi:hypothetical protein